MGLGPISNELKDPMVGLDKKFGDIQTTIGDFDRKLGDFDKKLDIHIARTDECFSALDPTLTDLKIRIKDQDNRLWILFSG